MNEKRQYPRQACDFKVNFKYFEGDPNEIKIESAKFVSGKGIIMDISKGGVFIVSNSRVSVNMPISLAFSSKSNKYSINGSIVRTGLLKNNPSEIAQRFA